MKSAEINSKTTTGLQKELFSLLTQKSEQTIEIGGRILREYKELNFMIKEGEGFYWVTLSRSTAKNHYATRNTVSNKTGDSWNKRELYKFYEDKESFSKALLGIARKAKEAAKKNLDVTIVIR